MNVLNRFNLSNKNSVVTGALGKLGYIWTKTLLEAGSKVACIDKNISNELNEFTNLKKEFKENLKVYSTDITSKKELKKIHETINNDFGEISILVNNAGIDQPPELLKNTYELVDIPSESFTKVIDVNLTGAFYCIQEFGKDMLKNNSGSIINIGSLYAEVSPDYKLYEHIPVNPSFLKPPAYGASKAALLNLTKYFSTHWGKYGIRVNMISPGGVEASQDENFKEKYCKKVPMKRMAKLEDLEGPLLFLASNASEYVTGINLKVDGGFTAW